MKRDYFIYKTHCELAITSNDIDPDLITTELNIIPDRYFRKGENTISKHSNSLIERTHNLWAIKSNFSELQEETISHHIEYLESILLPRKDILEKYKKDSRFEITFWVWIETDNAGIGIDLNEGEMGFLSSISNRTHFSIIANTN